MTESGLKIFFDGACHLCSREMAHYKQLKESELFEFVDISLPEFSASDFGLSSAKVNKEMHVIDGQGKVFVGVDAFVEIWKRLESWRLISKLAQWPVVYQLMQIGYWIFANLIRPILPKRRSSCDLNLPRK